MKNTHFTLLFILFLCFSHAIYSQNNNKPKIAVVLSGGGAKGIAHIPLLQKLDSLGIKPDLIVGTSMGSLVGGLYAMGYSADSIASITRNANWDKLLGGKIDLKDVSVSEKSEYKRYLLNFGIEKGKLKTNAALLNDQYLREFFSVLTFPVYTINDFDKLPIAYRAVATDIVNGEEIVLDNGSLAIAMRASMSIPSVFRPVPYEDTLLVDGGILNNFPVDVAKEWGADIIIGSDVGGGMNSKEKLEESIAALLFQSAMLVSNKKNPESRKLCDILVDHSPHLTHSTGDFKHSKEIYQEGIIGTNKQLDQLVALADSLKKHEQKKTFLPIKKNQITIDSIVYKGISEANMGLTKARISIDTTKTYTIQELVQGIHRGMGTNLFNQITLRPIPSQNGLAVEIAGEENPKHQIKAGLHYDTYRGVGLLTNYTGRNLLGDASRFLVSLDIAVQPRFRVQYQKQFGKKRAWWWRADVLGEFLNQEVYLNGAFADEYNFRNAHIDLELNKNIVSLDSYAGIGLKHNSFFLKPKSNPENIGNYLFLDKYHYATYEVDFHFVYNTLNTVFFPKKGSLLKAKVSRVFWNYFQYFYINEDTTTNTLDNTNNEISGATNLITKLSFQYHKRIPISKKSTLFFEANSNFILEDELKNEEYRFQDFGLGSRFSMGGNLINPRENSFRFPGLRENELNPSQMVNLHLGYQYNPMDKLYITPHINYASVGFGYFTDYIKDALLPKGEWTDRYQTSSVFSVGTTASYNSILGPVHFDVAYVNDIHKVRLFFSVGLFMPLSD